MPGNTILYCHEDLFDVVCRFEIQGFEKGNLNLQLYKDHFIK